MIDSSDSVNLKVIPKKQGNQEKQYHFSKVIEPLGFSEMTFDNLLLAGGGKELHIFDVTLVNEPLHIQKIDLPGRIYDIDVSEKLVYVATQAGIIVYQRQRDLLEQLHIISSSSLRGVPTKLKIKDNLLWAAIGSSRSLIALEMASGEFQVSENCC